MSAAREGADTLAADTLAAATQATARPPGRVPEQPGKIGRFTVLRQLGAGGMGVVYAAYDEQLDRKVAVKLLRHAPGQQATEGHARLLREAQALARLSHPNVVAVYEVGSFFEQVFLAMEFVQGQSLRAWLEAGPRPWREVLRVFVEAGRGLAAAHAVGLVHRDFKPDNVILGDDGRVRVLDFGLARAEEHAPEAVLPSETPTARVDLSSQLTVAGAVVGTPAYIAPELYARRPADARSDQFALCVSLWEALYGQRPFRGDSLQALALAICDGVPEPPPRDRRVPAWLHAAVLRGFDPDAERRFPSVDALLAALDRDPERRRVRLLGAAVIACVVALVGLGVRNLQAARAGQCTGGAPLVAGTWGHVQKDSLRAALVATGLPYAHDTADRVIERLDAYAAAWASAHRDACEDTAVRREQSQELLDLRMACLEGRRTALGELVALLHEPGEGALEHAVATVEGLPAIEACENASYVRATQAVPGTPDEAVRVAATRKQLDRIFGLFDAERFREAEPLLVAIERQDVPPPVRASVALARCVLDGRFQSYAAAQRACERAYLVARETDDARVAVAAPLNVLASTDEDQRSRELFEHWVRLAEVEVARAGAPLDRIRLLRMRGRRARLASEFDRADELLSEALARCEQLAGCRHGRVHFQCLTELGLARERKGDGPGALALYRELYDLEVMVLGPDHPSIGADLDLISGAYEAMGELDRSLAFAERALALRLRTRGPDSLAVAQSYNNIAGLLNQLGQTRRALVYFRETARIEEAKLGPDSPDLAVTLANMAGSMYQLEMYDEARRRLQRALKIQRATRTPAHYETMLTLATLASTELYAGQPADAEPHFREALAIAAARLGAGHVQTAMIWQDFAALLAVTGRADEAVQGLRRTRAALIATVGESHPYLARFDTALGDVEKVAGEPAAAEASLRGALARFEAMGSDGDQASLDTRVSLAALVVERDPAEALGLTERAALQARAASISTTVRTTLHVTRATAQARLGDRAAATASACLVYGQLPEGHALAERSRKKLGALGLLPKHCR